MVGQVETTRIAALTLFLFFVVGAAFFLFMSRPTVVSINITLGIELPAQAL